MREFEDRFVTLGCPNRVIGGPRFYERAEIRDALPICARSIHRPTISPRAHHQRAQSAASAIATVADAARPRPQRRIPLFEAARAMVETDELKPKARGSLRGLVHNSTAGAPSAR